MVAIPQYNQNKVNVDRTPTEYNRINVNPDAFGVGIAQANQKLGEASMYFFDSMVQMKKSIDQTRALELANYIDELEKTELNDPNNGYYSKLGKDAMADPEDPSKGANAVLEDIQKKINRKQQELGLSWGYGYKMAEYAKTKKMNMLYRGATAHELEETKNWGLTTNEEAKNLAISKGILHRDNEEDMATALGSGKATIIQRSQLLHWDADTTRIELAKFESNYHASIIQAYSEDGSLKATEYYNKHKDQLLPQDQEKCLELSKNTEIKYQSRTQAERLFNLYPEDEASAFAEVDKIQNERERESVENRLSSMYSRKRSIENHQQDNLLDSMYDNVNKKIQNGEVPSEDDIPLGLNGKNQIAARKYINDIVQKGDIDTDNSFYLDLYELSTTDAQTFAKTNLAQYRPYLSDSDYKMFQKKQVDIKNMTPTQLADDDNIIKNGLKSLGYTYNKKGELQTDPSFFMGDKTEKKAEAYKNTFNAYIRELELKKGKNLSREELGQAEREFTQLYKENKDKYIKGMNQQVGFMRNVINDLAAAEKQKGSALTSDEKNKIVADRVSKTVQKDNEEMSRSIKQATSAPKVGDIWQGHRITSLYGYRDKPTAGASTNHQGVDLAYKPNEKIEAFASGKVINVVYQHKGYGNYIDIQSADGTVHRYAHCNSIIARKGDQISAGSYIARAGSTGVSTGTHLHYEKIQKGRSVNPLGKSTAVAYAEGTVIRNPKTGARLVMKGGKWQQI